jgi:hypothetical protein
MSTLETILSFLGMFFAKNPTVDEIEAILPEVVAAITNAKAGQTFSVSFPESIDAVAGLSTFSWSPTTPAVPVVVLEPVAVAV